MVEIRVAFDPKYKSSKYATPTVGVSMTKQSFKDECDLNKIIAKFRKAGLLDQLEAAPQMYADVSMYADYHQSLERVQNAREMFATLPADIRSDFHNDAGVFVEFAANPDNEDEMRKMGLLPPLPPVEDLAPVPAAEASEEPVEGS